MVNLCESKKSSATSFLIPSWQTRPGPPSHPETAHDEKDDEDDDGDDAGDDEDDDGHDEDDDGHDESTSRTQDIGPKM